MINISDFIIKENKRKSSRFNNEVNRTKYYRCSCENCGLDKGYVSKSRFNKKPHCIKCATNTIEHKNKLKKSHWSVRGVSSKAWMKKDPTSPLRVKIGTNLRSRLNKAIKGNYKSGSAVEDLGCSIDEFKSYIESKFQPGMTWDNWGRDTWHIDHIVPISHFDLSNRDELLKACHYSNMCPLWAKDNMIKGNRI